MNQSNKSIIKVNRRKPKIGTGRKQFIEKYRDEKGNIYGDWADNYAMYNASNVGELISGQIMAAKDIYNNITQGNIKNPGVDFGKTNTWIEPPGPVKPLVQATIGNVLGGGKRKCQGKGGKVKIGKGIGTSEIVSLFQSTPKSGPMNHAVTRGQSRAFDWGYAIGKWIKGKMGWGMPI